jgi:threonine dehydratase
VTSASSGSPSSSSGASFDREKLASSIKEARGRIGSSVRKTRVEEIEVLPGSGVLVFAKMENEQDTGSFKLRGATNRILRLTPEEKARGVVTASNGNHGLGVATAAARAGISADIYVSNGIASSKAQRIKKAGGKVFKAGENPLDAEVAGRHTAESSGRVFISPYNDWDVLAGQGTIAVELLEQIPKVDAVFVAVGGGGLVGGIGAYLKHASPATEVVGCWPENSAVLYESMKAGQIGSFAEKPTVSESTAGGLEEGSITFDVCKNAIDSCVLVTEEQILEAMRLVQREKQWLIEGAAGVALAAFLKTAERYKGKTVVVVICGGNVSERVKQLL